MTKFLVHCASILIAASAAQSWGQTFQSIFSFPADGSQGTVPQAALTVGPDGSLYGTASEGGTANAGTAFKISTSGTFTLLGNFEIAETGRMPVARLVNIGDGFLYGVTTRGTGTAGDPLGTVFKLDPSGGATNAGGLTKIFALPGSGITPKIPLALVSGESNVLHVLGSSPGGIWRVPVNGDTPTNVFNFPTSGDDGLFPNSLIRGADGNLYGTSEGTSFVGTTPGRRGTVFKIAPGGTDFATIHDCLYETGVAPIGAMVQGPDGSFYGTTSAGGANTDGVIFRLSPSAGGFDYTVLHAVTDQPPTGDLLLASDGRLYGTSRAGGSNLLGSVFRVNTDGSGFQVIHTFTRSNGAFPRAGLVQALDGNLYGVTEMGGDNDKGTIFRIDLNLNPPVVNRRPIAIDDQGFSSGSAVGVNVLANDFDPDEDALTVTIETQPSFGTVVVEPNGSITYSVTVGGGYNGFDEFSYRITDPDGLFDVGTVTIADDQIPPVFQPTVYNGILNLDPNLSGSDEFPRGQLILNIDSSGAFTGKLFAQGKRYPVRGFFDEGGTAVAVVKFSKKNRALLFLAAGEGNSLLAVLFGQEQLSGYLSPILPDSPSDLRLTTALNPESAGLPQGFSFGAARFLSNGLVIIVGKLGDGSKLAWGTTAVLLDETTIAIPVYSEPVRGGFCAGNYVLPPGSDTFQAQLKWSRPPATKASQSYPAGFSGPLSGVMAVYIPPSPGQTAVDFGPDQSGQVFLSGPSVSPEVIGTVSLQGTRLVSSAPLQSFVIKKGTGLFTGKMKIGNKSVGFQGAVIQPTRYGYGFFTIDKVTGPVGFEAE